MVIHRFHAPFALLLLLALPAFAQPAAEPTAPPLTLGDALAGGRERARETVAARSRIDAAEARSREARSHRLPQVRLSEQWIRTDSPADAFGMLLNQERFSFGDFVAGDPNDPDALTTAITRIEVEMPIWTGGEISTRVEQARLAAEAAGRDAARVADRAAVAAAEAWIRLAQAREAAALLGKARDTVAAHVGLARDYATQGMLVRSDLLRAEVELARLDDLLAEARGNARLAESNLAFRLADPLDSRYVLAPLAEPPGLTDHPDSWLTRADSRPDLEAARKMLAAGELEAKARRAGRLPRIGVVARHDLVDDQLFGDHGDATTIAAMASIDLFDGGKKRAAVAAARADAAAGRADVERFAAGVRLEAQQAWEAASVALERRATAAAALDAAAESVRIVEERFRAGVVKSLDLLDAATARREAEMRELVARAEAWLARLHLALAAGEAPETVLVASNPTR